MQPLQKSDESIAMFTSFVDEIRLCFFGITVLSRNF